MQMLRSIVEWEPQFELVLDLEAALLLDVDVLFEFVGGAVDGDGLDLGREVFLVAEVVFEDAGVEAAEAGPGFGHGGQGGQGGLEEGDGGSGWRGVYLDFAGRHFGGFDGLDDWLSYR